MPPKKPDERRAVHVIQGRNSPTAGVAYGDIIIDERGRRYMVVGEDDNGTATAPSGFRYDHATGKIW
jgi:hypothetical protein